MSVHPWRAHLHAPRGLGERVVDLVSAGYGSWASMGAHAALFVAWFALGWDVGLLTNVVSLEAIFACIVLLMAANRQATREGRRDDTEAQEVEQLLVIQGEQLVILHHIDGIVAAQDEQLALLRALTGQVAS